MTQRKQPEDAELIRRHLAGDRKAFPLLYERYEKGVYFLVRQYFPQTQRAEEVFQEVFMKVLERLDRFHAEGSFRAWLWTLSRNHCIDRLRYQQRRPETPESALSNREEDSPGFLSQVPHGDPATDSQVYERELVDYLKKELTKLPEEQRETFLLKEQSGLTFEEIAQVMEVSINTVKSRMRYALAALRRSLKNKTFVKETRP